MQLTATVTIHMSAALAALATGPVALWARMGATRRPALHRAFGYAWVTFMVVAAVSAVFIRDTQLPNIAGFTPIHIFVPVTLFMLVQAFRALARRDIVTHRKTMQRLYLGACVVAGFFTLAPGRYLGELLGTRALVPIVTNTPLWVWGLLAALLAVGYSQTRDRRAGLARVVLVPLGMTLFSVLGTVSTFKASPLLAPVLGVGLVVALGTYMLSVNARPAGSYDAASRSFTLPGSWAPMLLILGIFAIKYTSGVLLALHPTLASDPAFVLGIAALNGAITGVFIGRAARLVRLALRPARPATLLQS
jgi:uncharacterized membrane protein